MVLSDFSFLVFSILGDFGVFGALHAGGREGSENDTLLHMTMTPDWQKFWNLAVKSYHPKTLAAEEKKNKKNKLKKILTKP